MTGFHNSCKQKCLFHKMSKNTTVKPVSYRYWWKRSAEAADPRALCCQKTVDVFEANTSPISKISFVSEPVAIESTFDTIFNPMGCQCCQIWPSHGKIELTNFIPWDYKWCQKLHVMPEARAQKKFLKLGPKHRK